MKTPRTVRIPNLALACALAAGFILPANLHAVSNTWDGGASPDQNWSNAVNWAGDANVPGSTAVTNTPDDATFNNNVNTTITIDANRNIDRIIFDTAAGAFTIGSAGANAGNALLLTSNSVIQYASTFAGAATAQTINAPLLLQGAAQFQNLTGALVGNTNTLQFNGNISGGVAAPLTITLSGNNVGASNIISSVISNGASSAVGLSKTAGATWSLTGTSNSFTGGVLVSQGILRADTIANSGFNSSIGAGSTIQLNGSTNPQTVLQIFGAGGTTNRALTFQSASTNHATIDASASGAVIFNGTATATVDVNSTLQLGGSSVLANAFNSNLADNGTGVVGLTKINAGTWTLGGTNNYTGTTTITAGTLNFGTSTALGGGLLFFGGNATFDNTSGGAFTKAVSGITLNGSPTFTGSSSLNLGTANVGLGTASGGTRTLTVTANTLSIGGIVNGTNGTPTTQFTKAGNGILEINGNSSNTGITTVSAGTLLVNGNHTGAGAYSVSASGTLGGSGSITTTGANTVTLVAGSKLSPGNATTPGTLGLDLGANSLNLTLAVTASNSQSMLFGLAAPGTSDRILLSNASSTLNIGVGVLNFDDFVFTVAGGFTGGIYTLFDTSSAFTGSLGANLTGTVGGFGATLSDNGQDIFLTVVPEPSTFVMLLGGMGMLLGFQRARRRA